MYCSALSHAIDPQQMISLLTLELWMGMLDFKIMDDGCESN